MNDKKSNLLEEDQSHQQEDTQQDAPERKPLHEQQQQVLLGSWSTLTTRLLTTTDDDAAAAAWNILDEPLGPDLAVNLNKELTPYWSQLRPAKTQGEVLANEAMQILSRHRFFQQNHDIMILLKESMARQDLHGLIGKYFALRLGGSQLTPVGR